ncbi:cysteine-rich receptor-like protein kinase 10 [Macadamia integrifolia]|uniref:cysteine-rich receptor-like protein kinase 10 n=1 Tax=Macadamia integrifolia TaxID=60698 RepID=UPI001C530C28|nr:cysteine-rich receptor-like protein kinase 10 [Macadamia integrifolia]
MEPSTNKTPRATTVLLFFFFALSFLVSFSSSADKSYLSHFCDNTTLFANHSSYQSNLNTLLSSLSSNASSNSNNGYRNATIGQSPNTVYGHYFCRGDATHDVCRDCVKAAAADIFRRCTNCKIGYIWYDMCTLRYSSQNFFNSIFDFVFDYLSNKQSVSDVTRFNQLLVDTMEKAATTAVSDSERFGTWDANFSQFQKLYCLAQCSPDISGFDCNRCLTESITLLLNCCSGKQGGRVFIPSCIIRFEMFPFYRVTDSVPSPPPPSNKTTSFPPEKQGSSSSKFVGIVVPIAAAGVIIFCILCFLIRKKKKGLSKNNDEYAIRSVAALQFGFSTVLAATKNFAEVNKIGEGGFGSVYKGKLPNGQEIAVKRRSKHSEQGAEEFKNEVMLVAKFQHRNLVSLLGFCLVGEEKILIYEFVPNKSLNYFLFDPEKRKQLDWERRSNIIGGIARGLLYLHKDSHLHIIHRDLKASNILLDEEMNAKISDFGMARIFGMDQTQANTNRIVGTYGYMAPEYLMHGKFSVKSDVFSFGVLVLEIITGKKNSSFYQSDFAEDLLSYAWRHWKAGTISDLIDPNLRENCSRSEVMRCVQMGLLCVQEDVADRPTMANIVLMLNRLKVTLPLPSEPAFFLRSRMESKSDQSKSRSTAISFNEMSVTELEPR